MNEHKQTDQCGFDRNASISEDTYVCDCGWRGEPAPLSSEQQLVSEFHAGRSAMIAAGQVGASDQPQTNAKIVGGSPAPAAPSEKLQPTPRTDAFYSERLSGPAQTARYRSNTEWADFARQLERELAAERRQYVQCSEALNRALAISASVAIPGDEQIDALFRKRDALENPLSADEVDNQIDRLLRLQFSKRRALARTGESASTSTRSKT